MANQYTMVSIRARSRRSGRPCTIVARDAKQVVSIRARSRRSGRHAGAAAAVEQAGVSIRARSRRSGRRYGNHGLMDGHHSFNPRPLP